MKKLVDRERRVAGVTQRRNGLEKRCQFMARMVLGHLDQCILELTDLCDKEDLLRRVQDGLQERSKAVNAIHRADEAIYRYNK